ncbi:MAG: CHASE2 domain-containing protein [Cyanobacteria bacterium P01_D01_bin.2]
MAAKTGIVRSLEYSIYNGLFKFRGEQPWDERVAVIEIDETSLAAIGQFPWPRSYYGELLKQIAPARPGVVAFDILFAESSEDDAALALAMGHRNVVLATAWDEQGGVIGPNALVASGAIATGHIHHYADVDGITRAYQPKLNGIPAFSIAAVQRYAQNQADGVYAANDNRPLWLNWPGSIQHSPRYSFVEVLTGHVPAAVFANKIVFIGFTGVGIDAMTTPYDRNPPAAGVYQHVVATHNLLTQSHLHRLTWPILGLFVLLSPMISYGLYGYRFELRLLASFAVIVLWSAVVIVAFSHNYWLPTMVPVLSIILTNILVGIVKGAQTRLMHGHKSEHVGSVLVPYTQSR